MHKRLDRIPRLTWIAATSVLWIALGGGHADAQSPEAEALFGDGEKLMDAGELAKACDAFESSNRVEPRAGTLIRLGECREKNLQLASAWSAYKDALTRVKDPAKRDIARAKVAELEGKLSSMTISVPADHRVDGLAVTRNGKPVDPMLYDRTLPIDGGSYALVASAPGHEAWKRTVEVPVDHGAVTIEVPKLDDARKPDVAVPVQARVEPTASPSILTPRRKVALAVAGGGALALGIGVALGVSATGLQHDARALCPAPQMCAGADQANKLITDAQGRAFGANLAFGVGAAAVITASVLWFTGSPETSRHVAITPTVAPGSTGVAVLASF